MVSKLTAEKIKNNVKIIYLVFGAGIQTHELSNMILLP